MSARTVAVIYDTSYLMLEHPSRLLGVMSLKECVEDHFHFFRVVDRKYGKPEYSRPTDHFTISEFVPLDVVKEVRKHFDDPEKMQAAKRARKIIARLIERGAAEINLEGICPASTGSSLGADSETDRRLLGLALSMVTNGWSCAIVATDDGGILYDAVWLKKAGNPVHCHTKERWPELHQFLANLVGWEAQVEQWERHL